ncbi:chain-length determining protein [Verrucomicrobiota bacterium]|nr:chain-length determining protein [Verrucomicrobiota bacterium]
MEAEAISSQPETKLHFLDYWRIIRIRKMVILTVFLLVVITTTAVTYVLPKTYMSSVRIDVQKDVSDVQFSGMSESKAYDPFFVLTQFEKLQSTAVIYPVITDLGLREKWAQRYGSPVPLLDTEAYGVLTKRLDLRQVRNTSLIEIRVFSEIPAEAREIAQKIAEVYRDNRLNAKRSMSAGGIKKLQEKLETHEKNIREKQKVVEAIRKDTGITLITPEGAGAYNTLATETLRHLDSLRNTAHLEFIEKDTRLAALRKIPRNEIKEVIVTVYPDELLATLLQKQTLTIQELAAKSKDLGAQHPEVIRVNSLLEKITAQVADRVDGILRGKEADLAAARARDEELTRAVEEAKVKNREAAEKMRDYLTAVRDVEQLERMRDSLKFKIQQEDIDMDMPKTSMVEITDAAELPVKATRPNIPLNIALGVIVGMIMGVGLAFFIEYLDTSVKTIDDVEAALQTSVLGVIPQNVGSLLDEGVDSPHAEAYRVLRTNLMFARKDPKANSLIVVSSGAGEGKTTTVLNLAVIFAHNGHKVLLVDTDIRRPSLHKRLNVSNSIGVTNVLLKQCPVEEAIQTTPIPNLHFLPSGRLQSSSLGILNSPQMREFIDEMKRRYDFVFFDSPPIMGVSDASILVSQMDLAMLVVQFRKYPQAMSVRAKQTIEKVGGNLMGAVLNNINIAQDSYYYYYSGYQYTSENQPEAPAVAKRATKGALAEKPAAELNQKY